jgi:hypothetical protein
MYCTSTPHPSLQVAAHADGREAVNEYDCLLLEHVFGNRPDDCHKVRVLQKGAGDSAKLACLFARSHCCCFLQGARLQSPAVEQCIGLVQHSMHT